MKRPYQPPELRRLELEQLTAEQREWIREERAKAAIAAARAAALFVDASETGDELARRR